MVVALAVPFRMRTQQVVRIVMLASNQALKVRVIDHQAQVNRSAHADPSRTRLHAKLPAWSILY